MNISVEYSTQIRTATALAQQSLEVVEGCSLASALVQLLQLHPKLSTWIDSSGQPRAGLLVFVNDSSPQDVLRTLLRPNDQVSLMTLVSGG